MRPEWLKCEGCLWWDKNYTGVEPDRGACMGNLEGRIEILAANGDCYCPKWTCARCWETWDEYDFIDPGAETGEDLPCYKQYKDHSKCQESIQK